MYRLMLATTVAILLFLAFVPSPGAAIATADGGRALPQPSGLRVLQRYEDAGIRVALTWEPVQGAFGYNVYRCEAEGGVFVRVGGKAADSMLDYPVFLDDTVEVGKGYYYAVTSVDAELNQSRASGKVFAALQPSARAAVGGKRMVCSLTDQRIYFYEGDRLVNVMRCSTGLSNPTPTGNFSIIGHYGTHSGLGGAVCDYWMAFTSAHGMHAWPRGNRNYEAGLGAPASHGCIRLHPLEAYWPYNWAPNGTPLTITYASLARRVVSGCHSSLGAPEPSPDWYFAEGYTALGYDTYLLLSNPGDSKVTARVYFLLEGGTVVEQDCGIAPHSRFTLAVDDVQGMESAAFSMQVHADGPVVAERAMYFASGTRTDGTVSVGANRPSTDWYFAEGYTAEGFDTYLLMANPGEEAVEVWVYFLLEGGATVDYVFLVGPRSRFTMPVDAFPGVGAAAFSMHVHADGPVVAERSMYFNKGYVDGGHSALGATQPSRSWFFAEGCTRNFFESYILVGNPGDADALVAMDFYLSQGSLRHEYLVRARERITVPLASQGGLDGNDMAFTLYATEPVVAERSVYYSLDSHRGGSVTTGSPAASPRWYFAEGCTDGAFDTYLLLSNPGFSPAYVAASFQRDDGATFAYDYLVPPQRRVTVSVDALPGLDRASFSAALSSDAPIVAERSMYFVVTRGY